MSRVSAAADRARGRVLQIGAGTGDVTSQLAANPAVTSLVAVEWDIARADRLRSLGLPRVDVVSGSVLTAPLRGLFDTVVLTGPLDRVGEVEEECLRRRLEHLFCPDGTLIVSAEVALGSDARHHRSPGRTTLFEHVEPPYGAAAMDRDDSVDHVLVSRWQPRPRQGPGVSVLLPTWNQAGMLPAAISSVLKQTYRNFELIVVDDGSTDDTASVLERVDDPRCRRVRVEHGGLPTALNVATSLARGEYITWTSSDNWCHERWLDSLVQALESRPDAVFAFTGYQLVDEAGQVIGEHVLNDPCIAALICQSPGLASFMYRASCLGEVGFYDPDLALAEDWDYWTRLVTGRELVYVPAVLYSYRLHSNSLTSRETPRILSAAREVLRRSLQRLGNPPRLEAIYPSLPACRDRRLAESDAFWDLGVRVLRSPWADPPAARPYLERAAAGRCDTRLELALVALEGCEGRWNAARARFAALRRGTTVPREDVIAACLDGEDPVRLRDEAAGPDPQASELIGKEHARYVWSCPGAGTVARAGKALAANLPADEWHESITRGTTAGNVADAVRNGAAPPWMLPILSETGESDSVLELGSGTGELSAHLARRGRATTLFDFSRPALTFAEDVFADLGLAGTFVQGDVLKRLPFDDRAFDVVWSSGLLEHFDPSEIAFIVKEAARVARKRVVALVPNASSLPYRLGKQEQERTGRWIWGREDPKATLEPIFRSAGLRAIREYSIAPEHALTFLDAPHMAGLRDELTRAFAALPVEVLGALNQGYLLVTAGDVEATMTATMTATASITPADTLTRLRGVAGSRPLFVWGAGRAGVAAVRYLRDRGVQPAGFIDSKADGERWVEGLLVRPPSHLRPLQTEGRAPFVVVASIYASEIIKSAGDFGIFGPDDLCTLQTPLDALPGVSDPRAPDFYGLLHELRGHALADMPGGANTVLSAGCSGRWYFDWVDDKYGRIERHIGAENFLPRPDNLPPNVQWLARDIARIPEVRDGEVELVFSGQNIEHLWPDQAAGFLCEAHRVLKQGGWLVLDSPNRDITRALAWTHPEHTIEYSVDDVREVLDAAGFAVAAIKGIWLCRDRGRLLPLSPFAAGETAAMEVLRRSALARDRAEDSFVWWAEARKDHLPQPERLAAALHRMFDAAWPERLNRFVVPAPIREDAEGRWAGLAACEHGIVVEGPLFPLRKGRHSLGFRIRGCSNAAPCRVRLNISRGEGDRECLLASVSAGAGPGGRTVEAAIVLEDAVTFALRVRVLNEGGGAGEVLLDCRCGSAPV